MGGVGGGGWELRFSYKNERDNPYRELSVEGVEGDNHYFSLMFINDVWTLQQFFLYSASHLQSLFFF